MTAHAEKHEELVFDIIRETGKDANWLNRYCKNEIVYYCEAGPNHRLSIHKGDKSGPVIATAESSSQPSGVTDITLLDDPYTFTLEHVHHKLPSLHGKTYFSILGKKYHWKGHSALVEEDTGKLVAVLRSKLIELHFHKLGQLLVTDAGLPILDFVVITCLVVQERSDEHKQALDLARKRALEMGIHIP